MKFTTYSGHECCRFPPGGKPSASARRLPGQRQRQNRPPATQPHHEAFKQSQVSPPVSSSSQDQQPTRPRPIPSQRRHTQQLTKERTQYKARRQRYASTRFEEQRQLHLPQKHKDTVPESTPRVDMSGLRSKPTTPRPATSTGSPFDGSGPSGPLQQTMHSTQRCGRRRLSPRR